MSALTNRLTIKELWQRKNRIEVFDVTKMLLFFTVLVGFHGCPRYFHVFFMVFSFFNLSLPWSTMLFFAKPSEPMFLDVFEVR